MHNKLTDYQELVQDKLVRYFFKLLCGFEYELSSLLRKSLVLAIFFRSF